MPSLLASAEPPVPCARCLKKVPRIRWGDLCPECLAGLRARATPITRSISIVAALLVIFYAWRHIVLTPASRVWVAVIALGTYFLVRRIATQIAIEVLRK